MIRIEGLKKEIESYKEKKALYKKTLATFQKICITCMTLALISIIACIVINYFTSFNKEKIVAVLTMFILLSCVIVPFVFFCKRCEKPIPSDILKLSRMLKMSNNNVRLLTNDQKTGYLYTCYMKDNEFVEEHLRCYIFDETSGEDDITVAYPDKDDTIVLFLSNNAKADFVGKFDLGNIIELLTMTSDEAKTLCK